MQVTTEARILRAMPAVALGLDYRPALLTGSGIARAVRELCRALARHGREVIVHLFGHSLARARRDEPIPPQCRLHRLPIPGRSLPLLAKLGLDAARLCGGVELFHWTDYIHPPLNQGMAVLTLHDLAFAADPSYHGKEQSQVLLERCRKAAKRSRMVITPTRATAGMARLHLQLEEEKLQVIPFGCDHVPDQPGPHPLDGRPFILTLGTIEPRKNHLLLLEAWRRLKAPRPALVVIGRRGWECEAAVRELLRARAQENLHWYQNPSDRLVFDYLAHAELLVYPSHLEGFGFPPLEAMAMGTAVVAGDNEALREVLGDAACYCDPKSVEDIAAAMQRLLEDQELRRRFCTAGKAVAETYSWDACAQSHLRLYRKLSLELRR